MALDPTPAGIETIGPGESIAHPGLSERSLNVAGPVLWSVKVSIMTPEKTCERRRVFDTRN